MKKILITSLLFLASCGGSSPISKAFYTSEQSRIDAYYTARSQGGSFSDRFYFLSDSLYSSLGANKKLLSIYENIGAIRQRDSLNQWTSSEYIAFKKLLDDGFNISSPISK